MTFETKLNLLKMKPDQQQQTPTQADNASTGSPSATNSSHTTLDPSDGQQRINRPTTSFDLGASVPGGQSAATSEQVSYVNQAHQEGCFFANDKSCDQQGAGMQTSQSQSQSSSSSSGPATTSVQIQASTSSKSPNFKASEEPVSAGSVGGGAATTSDSSGSDSDSSSHSSSDEADIDEISDWDDYGAEKTRQNLVKLVDKIASSRYFSRRPRIAISKRSCSTSAIVP